MINIRNYKKIDNAFNDYCLGLSYREISFKYGVKVNTVKSWVHRYGWAEKRKHFAPINQTSSALNEIKKFLLKLEIEVKNNEIVNVRIK